MKRKFILDEEINLLEKDSDSKSIDYLNTGIYAKVLKECIVSSPENKSFTIGLFGEWGSGKSSIIKTVKDAMSKEAVDNGLKIKLITYDAWKYANDSFRRMFLLQLQKDLGFEQSEFMQSFYYNKSEDTKVNLKLNTKKMLLICSIALILILVLNNIEIISTNWKFGLTTCITFCTLMITISSRMFDDLKVSVQKPHLFAPEQFENCFDEMVEKSLKKYTWKEKVISYLKGENYEKNIDRLIIVIDNIDRCHKELAYELLTNIKNFLGDSHNIIFVIPVDIESLKKHIVNTSKSDADCNRESEEFLRKFFNMSIRIKPFHSEEMFDFADKLNVKYNLEFEPTTISLVSNEFATNPRRIIQMFNNLIAELECLPNEISEHHQPAICKILIIREEFPEYYKELIGNPSILFTEELSKVSDSNLKLKIFLNKTFAVTNSYRDKIDIIERILSNSIVFDNIPSQIKDAISVLNNESILEYVKQNENQRKNTSNYLIKKLEIAIQRKLYSTDAKNTLDIILYISTNYHIEKSENIRVIDIIKSDSVLSQIIDNTDNMDNIILYGLELKKQNLSKLNDYIINTIRTYSEKEEAYPNKIFDAIVFGCSKWNKRDVGLLKEAFLKAYKQNAEFLMQSDYRENYSILFYHDFINYIIEHIDFTDPEKLFFIDFKFVCQKIEISESTLNAFLEKANSFIAEYDYNTNNSEIINHVIKNINSVLYICQHINYLKNTDVLQTICMKLTKVTSVGNYSTTTQRSYLIDNFKNEALIDNFIKYFCLSSKISNKNIIPISALSSVAATNLYSDRLNDVFLTLHDKGYNIEYYSDVILNTNTYSDDWFLLIEYLMLLRKGEEYILSNDLLENKLAEILNLIWDDTVTKEKAILFIERLIDDERAKVKLANIISSKTREEILKLSPNIQKLVLKTFVENINNYEQNKQVLFLIASSGNLDYIQKVVQIVNTKLNTLGEEVEGLAIIVKFTVLNKLQANSLKSNMELIQERNELKDFVEKGLKHIAHITAK